MFLYCAGVACHAPGTVRPRVPGAVRTEALQTQRSLHSRNHASCARHFRWHTNLDVFPFFLTFFGPGVLCCKTFAGTPNLDFRLVFLVACLSVSISLAHCGKKHECFLWFSNRSVEVEGAVTVNFGKVMERLRKLRAGISHHDSAERFTNLGVDVYIGHGEFTSPNTIEVCEYKTTFACRASQMDATYSAFAVYVEARGKVDQTIESWPRGW